MNLMLLLGLIFLGVFLVGIVLEKIRVPWIFAALLLGLAGSEVSSLRPFTTGNEFNFLGSVGLLMLLFMIGFELDIGKLKSMKGFIVKSTFAIELFEMAIVGSIVQLLFHPGWGVSMLVALSFATVGEALLLPILDAFRITKTKLGQAILGIATFDDVIEVATVLIVVVLGASSIKSTTNPLYSFLILSVLGFSTMVAHLLKKRINFLHLSSVAETLPLLVALLFIFAGMSDLASETGRVLAGILAGFSARNLLPDKLLVKVEPQIQVITYGIFAPIFLFKIGSEVELGVLVRNLHYILILIVAAKSAKIFASWLMARHVFDWRRSVFMGVALSVRFSTSIVIVKLLLDGGYINTQLFSVLIGAAIVFKFILPFTLSIMANKWHIGQPYQA